MAGRPRGIDDAAILQAAVRVMGRTGPARLTLAAVAGEVGLVAGTLLQRFGSKRGMLVALAERSAREVGELHARVRAERASPLAALAALTAGAWSAVATAEEFANHLAFLCTDLADPELHRLALASQQAEGAAVRTLLDEAVAAGELRTETDTALLARSVQAATIGTGVLWAVDRKGTLAERRLAALGSALQPHLHPHPHP
ncbi:TetR/AcrR family transcriptional regulator [Streptomyces sp. ISL-94]|uniref:TetR/AcrR family transcriptional regulator n=1 Tax=Streptomyces sp. ISL-94 TaxID=2819190 RepID=UPI001BE58600|nr:TetR/AcrR family transcriptional regulator [Streptomyces sp. ISL-94]MBT2480429.1 TetR/AcrR family transcriptional regulator [Streptomyces sp. ISL-94]